MAFKFADRIKETTTTTGTGNLTLAGAVAQFLAFSTRYSNGDTFFYGVRHATLDEWEVGFGAYVSATPAIARTTIFSSSNSDAAVDFSAGTKEVWVDFPAAAIADCIPIACSDETTALTAGTAKITFRMPYAFMLQEVRASLTTAQASGSIFTVDINEGGTSVLSTKLTIDNTEKTSVTAAAAAVISDGSLADDAEITIDIGQIGDGTAKGLKVYLIGVKYAA